VSAPRAGGDGVLVAVTDHAAERFRQRVGTTRGAVDVKPEVAGRVSRAWAAGRVEVAGGALQVRDLEREGLVYVCRHDPRAGELVVVSAWEEGEDAKVPRRFTDALRRSDHAVRDRREPREG